MSGAAKFGIGVLIAAGILLMLALIVLIAYFWMASHGKSAFAEKQEAVPEQMQAMMRMMRWRREAFAITGKHMPIKAMS